MRKTTANDERMAQFFANPTNPVHRQYLALRSFYLEMKPAKDVAAQFGFSVHAVYSMAKKFKARMQSSDQNVAELFFQEPKRGRPKLERDPDLAEIIVSYRKKQLSVPDIKLILNGRGYDVTEELIYKVCDDNGFARLPKRSTE